MSWRSSPAPPRRTEYTNKNPATEAQRIGLLPPKDLDEATAEAALIRSGCEQEAVYCDRASFDATAARSCLISSIARFTSLISTPGCSPRGRRFLSSTN